MPVLVQRHVLDAAAAARGPVLARRVDDDVAHRLGGIREEVMPVLEPKPARIDQPHEALVHEHGRVHRIGAALAVQAGARHAAQVRVERREHPRPAPRGRLGWRARAAP
jgi:hypothetical protein